MINHWTGIKVAGNEKTAGRTTRLRSIGIVAVLVAAGTFYLATARKDLPYLPRFDEPVFVRPAVRMVSTNDFNPGWFGHPGSTVIYPLAALYRFSAFIAEGGNLFAPRPAVRDRFENDPGGFYLSGRILMTLFALAAIYVAYLAGREIGGGTGLAAAGFVFLSPLIAAQAAIVRTDSASLFFALAAVYALIRLQRFQRPIDHLLAGALVGLAVATKYSLAPLIFVLLAVDTALIIRSSRSGRWSKTTGNALLGMLAVPAAFLLATPFFLAEFETVQKNIRFEMRSEHLGQDGLTAWGNLWWYLTVRIPEDMGLARLAAAAAGLAAGIIRRDRGILICAASSAALLAGISSSALHWSRWLVPVLGPLYIVSAYGICAGAGALRRFGLKPWWCSAALAGAVIAVSVQPAGQMLNLLRVSSNYSTRVLALRWAENNLPAGSCLVQELWTLPSASIKHAEVLDRRRLSDRPFEYYLDAGCRYLLASGRVYQPILADPERYPREAAFYRRLFAEFELVAEFTPSRYRPGPSVRIYRLPTAPISSDDI